MKKLTVVVPCYNVEDYLCRCLDSLVHQDIPESDYEVIAVDDGAIHIGDIVKHAVFGQGTVVGVKPNGSCEVQFASGVRTLLPRVLTKE